MASGDNVKDRLLVILASPSKNGPYCVRVGKWDSGTEAIIAYPKRCILKDAIVSHVEGEPEEFKVTPEMMLTASRT